MFTLSHKDTVGATGHDLMSRVGSTFWHVNGNAYKVLDVVYDGVTDMWSYLFQEEEREDAPKVVRDHISFFGLHRTGVPRLRFIQDADFKYGGGDSV